MIKDKNIIYKDTEYMEIVKDIISNEMVLKMKQYRQHFNTTCFDHCLYVSYNLYIICNIGIFIFCVNSRICEF